MHKSRHDAVPLYFVCRDTLPSTALPEKIATAVHTSGYCDDYRFRIAKPSTKELPNGYTYSQANLAVDAMKEDFKPRWEGAPSATLAESILGLLTMCVSSLAAVVRHKSDEAWLITPYCVIQNRAHDCEPILDNTVTVDKYTEPADIINDLTSKGFSKVYIACPPEVCDDPGKRSKEYHERYSQQLAMGCFSDVKDPITSPLTDADSPPPQGGGVNEHTRCKTPPQAVKSVKSAIASQTSALTNHVHAHQTP